MTEDELLILRLKENDSSALTEIYNSYSEPCIKYATAICKSEEISAEAAQNTFITLWNSRHRLHGVYNLRGYLFKCTKWHLLAIIRKQKKQELKMDSQKNIEKSRPKSKNELEIGIEQKDMYHQLDRVIKYLHPFTQEIYHLHTRKKMPLKEVSAVLNISYTTVHRHSVYLKEYLSAVYAILNRGQEVSNKHIVRILKNRGNRNSDEIKLKIAALAIKGLDLSAIQQTYPRLTIGQFKEILRSSEQYKFHQQQKKIQRIEEIRKCYESGMYKGKISKKFSIGAVSLNKLIKSNSWTKPELTRQEAIVQLRRQGYSDLRIAKQMCLSASTVKRYRVSAGIECPSRLGNETKGSLLNRNFSSQELEQIMKLCIDKMSFSEITQKHPNLTTELYDAILKSRMYAGYRRENRKNKREQLVAGAIEAYRSGLSLCLVARTFGIYKSTLSRWIAEFSVERRPGINAKLNEATVQELISLRKSGNSHSQISKKLSLSISSVSKYCKSHKI